MPSFISDIPGVGGLYDDLRGNPEDIKAAYDKAMGFSGQSAEKLKQFMLGQQHRAQSYFGPMQAMFQGAYGTKGIQGPTSPGVPGSSSLGPMFQGGRP